MKQKKWISIDFSENFSCCTHICVQDEEKSKKKMKIVHPENIHEYKMKKKSKKMKIIYPVYMHIYVHSTKKN